MSTDRKILITAALAAAIAVPAVAAGTAQVTKRGVGPVKIGVKHETLRDRGLVGRKGNDCGGLRAAKLSSPLKGTAYVSPDKPFRVDNVLLRRGAQAEGVGFGDTRADIKAAFPHTKFITGAEKPFGITIAEVPKRDGGKFQFGIDVDTERITQMGVPYLWFC